MIETKAAKKLSPKELLEKYLATHHVPIANTVEELYKHSDTEGTPEERAAEVDAFLHVLEAERQAQIEAQLRILNENNGL
jgi:hypothetical protein